MGAPVIDWSGNCGNLSAAVGPFAISAGLVEAPPNGTATGPTLATKMGSGLSRRSC
jgi:2-methylaconitate cis-trans-isomerase PrpF